MFTVHRLRLACVRSAKNLGVLHVTATNLNTSSTNSNIPNMAIAIFAMVVTHLGTFQPLHLSLACQDI